VSIKSRHDLERSHAGEDKKKAVSIGSRHDLERSHAGEDKKKAVSIGSRHDLERSHAGEDKKTAVSIGSRHDLERSHASEDNKKAVSIGSRHDLERSQASEDNKKAVSIGSHHDLELCFGAAPASLNQHGVVLFDRYSHATAASWVGGGQQQRPVSRIPCRRVGGGGQAHSGRASARVGCRTARQGAGTRQPRER